MAAIVVLVPIIEVMLAAFVVALTFYAFYYLTQPTIQLIASAVRGIPVIGDHIADLFNNLTGRIEDWAAATLRSNLQAVGQPFFNMENWYANSHSGELYSQRLVNGRLTYAVIAATERAMLRVNQPTQTYVTDSNTVNNTYITANTDQVYNQSVQYTEGSYIQLADWANGAIQTVYRDVVETDNDIKRLASYTDEQLTQTRQDAASLAQVAKNEAVDSANAYTLKSFEVGEHYTTQVRDYSTSLAAETTRSVEDYTTAHIAASEAHVATEISTMGLAVAAVEATFTDFMKNCGTPLCDGGVPFVKGLLSMKELLGIGLLAGFIAEAVANPDGTAKAVVAVEDAITAPVKAIAKDVFGV